MGARLNREIKLLRSLGVRCESILLPSHPRRVIMLHRIGWVSAKSDGDGAENDGPNGKAERGMFSG